VIYTSGSTGQPKGVAIRHSNTNAMLHWANSTFAPDELSKVLASTSLNFDLSVFELFVPLCFGYQCILVKDAFTLIEQRIEPSLINTVPSAIKVLLENKSISDSVKLINLAGEPLSTEIVNEILNNTDCTKVYNLYGPSEDTTYSTSMAFTSAINNKPGIGRVIANSQAFVLTQGLELAPFGVAGELYLSGAGVAKGYLNKPELTAERFIDNPYYDEANHNSSKSLYKTGDLVRYLPDGNLEYINRIDDQVKIRGFRIELGEIESHINKQAEVDSVLVLAKELMVGEKQLVAYVKRTAVIQTTPTANEVKEEDSTVLTDGAFITSLKEAIANDLPNYMVPSLFVIVPEWPLMPNGKINRSGLPEPDGSCLLCEYVAAESVTERSLVAIWSTLLKLDEDKISITADFFDLGGHSLLATRLALQVRSELRQELAIKVIFESPTISELAQRIDIGFDTKLVETVTSVKRLEGEPVIASFAQQRLWFLDQLQGGSAEYHMPLALLVEGDLKFDAAEQAIVHIIQRHESLRTVFKEHDKKIMQVISSTFEFTLKRYDLTPLDERDQQERVKELIKENSTKPFNLSKDLIIRSSYIHLEHQDTANSVQKGILLFNIHHIAFDGWSMNILLDEFTAYYQSIIRGELEVLSPLAIQYADYAYAQNKRLQGDFLDSQLSYWENVLTDAPSCHNLPLDRPRTHASHKSGTVSGHLSKELTLKIAERVKEASCTLFMLMQSALAVHIGRLSYETDVVLGAPTSGRNQREIEPLIGLFTHTQIFRTTFSDNPSFKLLLARTKQEYFVAQEYNEVPLESIVERISPARNLYHTPIFQVLINLNNNEVSDSQIDGVQFSPIKEQNGITNKYDLTLYIKEEKGKENISLSWVYDASLFDQATIEMFAQEFEYFVMQIIQNPKVPVLNHSWENIVSRSTIKQPDNKSDIKSLASLFEAQVQASPEDIALSVNNQELSFDDLNRQANKLAHLLSSQYQVSIGSRVAIATKRNSQHIIAVLALIKLGACYIPLSEELPQVRLQYMIENSQSSLVLTDAEFLASHNWLKNINGEETISHEITSSYLTRIVLDCKQSIQLIDEQPDVNPKTCELPEKALANIIYTSGSTGKPKGVMGSYEATFNRIAWMLAELPFDEGESVIHITDLASIVAIWEMLVPLCGGARLLFCSRELLRQTDKFSALLNDENITRLKSTPSLMNALMETNFKSYFGQSLRHWFVGGELLVMSDVKKVLIQLPELSLYNLYGSTEVMSDVLWAKVTLEDTGAYAPAGYPISGADVVVTDFNGQQVPDGVIGELVAYGVGVANGYVDANVDSQHNFIQTTQGCGFRTGDIGWVGKDNQINCIGRIDEQIKIRGYRVELGEIASQILLYQGVNSCSVITLNDALEQKRIVAYVVVEEDVHDDEKLVDELKITLQKNLPSYMVPSAFVVIDKLPLMENGKLDKKALPEPDGRFLTGEYVAAETATEKTLVAIWSSLLKLEVDEISTTANFFTLGGHSLLVMRLVSEIRKQLQCELSVKAVFESPSIQALSVCVTNASDTVLRRTINPRTQENKEGVLSFAQQRLWFIDKFNHGSAEYNMPAAFDVVGAFDVKAVEQAISLIITRHAVLRTVYIENDEETSQYIQDSFNFTVQQHDLTFLCDAEKQARLATLIECDIKTPFNLGQDLMIRVSFILRDKGDNKDDCEQQATLLFNMHHIASDGWSMKLLISEFATQYQAIITGQPALLLPLEVQYADYAHWQREWLQGEEFDSQLSYWDKQLADLPSIHSLSLDETRPEEKQYAGARVSGQLSGDIARSLQHIAKAHQLTPFMLLHAALALVLARHSNSDDIVIGTPVANRLQAEIEPLIGFFVNNLVLRLDTNHQSLSDYLAHVREVHLDAQSNQDVPFERLVEQLNIPRSSAYTPVFQIMLTTDTDYGLGENKERQELTLPGLTLSPLPAEHITAKFDLDIRISLNESGVNLEWIFDKAIFNEAHIAQFNDHLSRLLTGLATVSETELVGPLQIKKLPMLSTLELDYSLNTLNDTEQDYPTDKCLHELFEAQAVANPNNIAVVFEDEQLTYQELNQQANKVAHYLAEHHDVTPNTLVGICVERSLQMVVGLLGILKAGGAYVPLDPSYPTARLQHIINDTGINYLLDQSGLHTRLELSDKVKLISINDTRFTDVFIDYPVTNRQLADKQPLSSLAYVIHTSGSTGTPKGVMIEQGAFVNFLQAMLFQLGPNFNHDLKLLAVTTMAFDIAGLEIWGPLFVGGQVVLASKDDVIDPSKLSHLLNVHDINFMQATPAGWRSLLDDDWAGKKDLVALSGGELLPDKLAKSLMRNCAQLWNCYGPTEATVWSLVRRIDCDNTRGNIANLAGPLSNYSHYVLDSTQEVVPQGVIGELYIGGTSLARGYLNNPDLTKEKFIADPFASRKDARLYRTGDLVRLVSDGQLEFVGRTDTQ
ncbi:non-ribosomal peptide synthetase, partial [Colwellia psychrerythraea]|uniref:non-ribosomal peptide synthetase n=1 Tax=Colwellia psychrerythraea TaxID=28229 RepID=UPI00051A535F